MSFSSLTTEYNKSNLVDMCFHYQRKHDILNTMYISTTTCYGRLFRSSSGRYYNDLNGKVYVGGASSIHSCAPKEKKLTVIPCKVIITKRI